MTLPEPCPGLIIRYSYLWWDEARRGQEDGRKDRPCAIILSVADKQGRRRVLLAPISHSPPRIERTGVEIPASTKQRLGLDSERSWIVTDELNRFLWPGPDLRPVSRILPASFSFGLLPPALFEQVKVQIKTNAAIGRTKMVERDA